MERMNLKFTTPVGRLSFPSLFEKKAFVKGQDPKWGAQLILEKGAPGVDEFIEKLRSGIKDLVLDEWPTKEKRPAKLLYALKDGDTWAGDDGTLKKEKYPEYENCWIVCTSNKSRQPKVFDAEGEVMDQNTIYAGCYGFLSFNATSYNNVYKGVGFWTRGFKKVRDGEPLAGGGNVADDFDGYEDSMAGEAGSAVKTVEVVEEDDFLK